MPQNKDLERRFTWNIHYDCNYRCPYCFFEGKWVDYKKRNVYLSPDEWMKFWERIHALYGRCYLLITGGEPFTYPGFIELMEKISAIHYPINISSNASGDLENFAKRVSPEKVNLSLSLQLNFQNLATFSDRVRFLKSKGFTVGVNLVAYPPFLRQIDHFRQQFNLLETKLKVIPFWGRYQDKEYPFAYTKEEKELIEIDDSWFSKVKKKNMICPAGHNSALIFPDGKVSRCGQIGEKKLIGNFFDQNFKLLESPSSCEAEFCPCDENNLFGESEEEKTQVKAADNQKIDSCPNNTCDNALLNDSEYAAGKTLLSSSPRTIFIQAAGPCNSSCVFCSRGKDYDFFDLQKHKASFEEKIYPFIQKAENLILTGSGEYLNLPNAKEIIDFFDNKFSLANKCFSTNGSPLVPEIADKIMDAKSNFTIHVSLHASNPALHKVMTRMDNFDQITENIKYIISRRKDKNKPQINLIFVATTLNIEDLPDFVRLAANLKADKVICYYNFIYVPAQKYLSCFFKQKLTNRVFEQAQVLADELKIPISLPPKFGQDSYPNPGPCREPFSQIMFDVNGRVLPCDASETCNEILADKDFMDIWNGEYYQNLRQGLLAGSSSCSKHCIRANPKSVNEFKSHVIHRGGESQIIDTAWGDNF